MNNIGRLIKVVRESRGYSRERLSSEICSSKYIYLIENGVRTPSTEVLIKISDKLNFNFHDCFPYMGCQDPLCVKIFVEEFQHLRAMRNLDKLDERTEDARKILDFNTAPWKSELDYNQIISKLFRGENSDEIFVLIQKGIQESGGCTELKLQENPIASVELLRLYNLLAVYYYMVKNNKEGFRYLSYTYQILDEKKEIARYQEWYLLVAANYLNALYLESRYESAIETANSLLEYHIKVGKFDRCHLAHFMIAMVNHTLGNNGIALNALRKALVFCQVYGKLDDLKELVKYDFVKVYHRRNELKIDLIEGIQV